MSIATIATAAAVLLAAAYGAGQFTTKSITTEITIDAPASAVWEELFDGDEIASWNPFMKRLEGALEVGQTLGVTVQQPGGSAMDFAPLVLVADQDRELRWVGKLGVKGVFDGEHYFILEEQDDGSTLLRHGETFTGMLALPLYAMIGESTTEGFKAMNAALKERVEG